MKNVRIWGYIAAILLIVFAVVYPVPSKEIDVGYSPDGYRWTDSEGAPYVGGDAYNFQMEASLKAGYMSGVLAMKSISFTGGLLLLFMTLYFQVKCDYLETQVYHLTKLFAQQESSHKLLEQTLKKLEEQDSQNNTQGQESIE